MGCWTHLVLAHSQRRVADWYDPILTFAYCAVIAGLVHLVSFAPRQGDAWKVAGIAIGTFFGILWVVAFSEELFFRGVIAKAVLRWKSSIFLAILVSSLLFGSVHLWYHDFPNWKMAVIAAIAGCFFARAYFGSGSVRAAMVTHALTVVTWRMLFTF